MFDPSTGFPSNRISGLSFDKAGKLWVLSFEGHLCRFEDEDFHCDLLKTEDCGAPYLIAGGGEGTWITTAGGTLFMLKDDIVKKRIRTEIRISGLFEDHSGRLWAWQSGGGLFILKESGFHPIKFEKGEIQTIYEDRNRNIWIGTTTRGLYRASYDSKTLTVNPISIPIPYVFSFFEDREGSLWVGSLSEGLFQLRDGAAVVYDRKNGLSDENSFPLYAAGDRLFVGTTTAGLNILEEKKAKLETFDGLVPQDSVPMSITGDRRGSIFIGVENHGLVINEGNKNKLLPVSRYPFLRSISGVIRDKSGDLWIATWGKGVFKGKEDVFSDMSKKIGLDNLHTSSILRDDSDRIWVSTDNGIIVYDGKSSRSYDEKNGLADNMVYSLFNDSKNRIWALTRNGITIFSKNKLSTISKEEGMPFNTVYCAVEDERGNFWISSNHGIILIKQDAIRSLLKGEIKKLSPTIITSDDGLKSIEFNGGSMNCCTKTEDGRIWFPSIKGVVSVDPSNIPKSTIPPTVKLESVDADEKEYDLSKKRVVFPPGTSHIHITYSALSYVSPSSVKFRYRLQGFDRSWINGGNSRRASYTNIAPGSYIFSVIAAGREGIWNERSETIELIVKPFFYQSPYFYLLIGISITFMVYAFFRWRVNEVRNRERILRAMVAEKTSELREASLSDPLTGLRNRRFYQDMVKPELNRIVRKFRRTPPNRRDPNNTTIGIFLLDIDFFKSVNDTYGHDVGDMFLKNVASTLKKSVRIDDVIVRWGGEEFLIVLKNSSPDFLSTFAKKLKDRIAASEVPISEKETISRTVSIGFAPYPFYPEDPEKVPLEDVAKLADMGLYHAKINGRNMVVNVNPGRNLPGGSIMEHSKTLDEAEKLGYIKINMTESSESKQ